MQAGLPQSFFLPASGLQAAVGDKRFLKSMIPHHAAAILMAQEASLRDPEIKQLAQDIIKAQQAEIVQMKAKLNEMKKK